MKRAGDRIFWTPGHHTGREVKDLHRCPTAVVSAWTVRQALDPMALGVCRFCGEKLS